MVVALCSLLIGCSQKPAPPATAKPANPVSDDRDVIQSALLSFFHEEDWHAPDWKPKKHVILRPSFSSKPRANFKAALSGFVKGNAEELKYATRELYEKKGKLTPDQIAELKQVIETDQKQTRAIEEAQRHLEDGEPYIPAQIVPIKSHKWDPRIVISAKSNRYSFGKERDETLEAGTVYATASPPCYSANGRYAIILFHIPWSIHGADVGFLYERTSAGWTQIAFRTAFYV